VIVRCECNALADHVCQQCGTAECMRCHRQYEWINYTPALCWRCQSEADREWLRTDLSKPPRRTPREMQP
jgi:hypothetical protein